MDRLCIRKDFCTTARKNWPRPWTSDTRARGGMDWLGIWKENYRQIERVRGKWVRNIRDNPAKNGAAWNWRLRARGEVDWLGIWKENYRQLERVRGTSAASEWTRLQYQTQLLHR